MRGELVVVDDVAVEFVERFRTAFGLRTGSVFSVALSGGDTARRCYETLAAADGVDWMNVDLYWGDERCVPLDHEDSNHRLARETLMEPVGAVDAFYPMRCEEGADPYQLRLVSLGPLDLVHLGLGPDAHVASLFPDSPALSADPGRLVTLNEDPHGNNPHRRMTLTLAGIARARLVLVTVEGAEKRDALDRVRAGDPTAPGSHVGGTDVVWIADRAAAGA